MRNIWFGWRLAVFMARRIGLGRIGLRLTRCRSAVGLGSRRVVTPRSLVRYRGRVAGMTIMIRSWVSDGGRVAIVTLLRFRSGMGRCRIAAMAVMLRSRVCHRGGIAVVLGRTRSRVCAIWARMRDWQRIVIIILRVALVWEWERRLNMWRLRWFKGVGWDRSQALGVTFRVSLAVVALWIGFRSGLGCNRGGICFSTMRH